MCLSVAAAAAVCANAVETGWVFYWWAPGLPQLEHNLYMLESDVVKEYDNYYKITDEICLDMPEIEIMLSLALVITKK